MSRRFRALLLHYIMDAMHIGCSISNYLVDRAQATLRKDISQPSLDCKAASLFVKLILFSSGLFAVARLFWRLPLDVDLEAPLAVLSETLITLSVFWTALLHCCMIC
ncbi:hypothetical protein BJ878DRAFT_507723 [Calycina marina]|uniref:Uncharacterized protein n=1 Tax=Calycina marina TaxID=1763456 RepID=A0A9P7Z2K0_9HELO|nr:hypothetical protein BJ878DRAFT_507723 [Calycina marina]